MSKWNILKLLISFLLIIATINTAYNEEVFSILTNFGLLIGVLLVIFAQIYKEKYWLEPASTFFFFSGLCFFVANIIY